MVVRAGRAPAAPPGFDPLLLATSLLGLVWNLCALPVYELPKVGIRRPVPLSRRRRLRRARLPAGGGRAFGAARRPRRHPRSAAKRSLAASRTPSARRGAAAARAAPLARRAGAVVARHAAADLHVRRAGRAAGGRHTWQPGARRALWAAALATFAVSALHLSQLHTARRRGRSSSRPSRVAAAGVRDPVPGLSVRARGSVPEARADAARARRGRVRGHRDVRRAIRRRSRNSSQRRSAAGRRPGHAVGRDRAAVSAACAAPPHGSSTRSCCIGPTTDRCARPSRARRRTRRRCPRRCSMICAAARAGAERARRDLARVTSRRRRGARSAVIGGAASRRRVVGDAPASSTVSHVPTTRSAPLRRSPVGRD